MLTCIHVTVSTVVSRLVGWLVGSQVFSSRQQLGTLRHLVSQSTVSLAHTGILHTFHHDAMQLSAAIPWQYTVTVTKFLHTISTPAVFPP